MTEAKSPREIAAPIAARYALPGFQEMTTKAIETAILSYAAEQLGEQVEGFSWPNNPLRGSKLYGLDDIEPLLERAEKAESYAAERERLLAEADAVINWATDAFPISWMGADSGVGRALERHRLRSRPATEGKGDD